MKFIIQFSLATALALTAVSCKKDKKNDPEPTNTTNPPTAGGLKILFEPEVGGAALAAGTTYTNQAGNTFNVTMFKYYISNVRLTRMDNSVWSETESYHLVDNSNGDAIILIGNVPFGDYKAVEFMIGVDSARNVSGAQTGDLDVNKNMFWSWAQGYIMAKFEGNSPQSTATNNKLEFHIGGFGGANKATRIVSPSFNGDTAKVSTTVTPVVHMSADLLQWFQAPNVIDFSTLNTIHMPGSNAVNVANNYIDMFTVEHIHND